MSHSYKKRSRRNRPYHSYTYRSREYRQRRMRRRLLFSLGVLLLLFIGSHVISIYASKGHADRNEQNKPPGAPDVKGQEDSSEVYNPSDTTLVKEDSHTQEVSSDHQAALRNLIPRIPKKGRIPTAKKMSLLIRNRKTLPAQKKIRKTLLLIPLL